MANKAISLFCRLFRRMQRIGEISRRRYQPAPVSRHYLNAIRSAPVL